MNNMTPDFDLQAYLSQGVERLISDVMKATLRNPRESAYMLRFAKAAQAAAKTRQTYENQGEHIPTFLIASITSQCNLHCTGCYSRCNHATVDEGGTTQLTAEEWGRIFQEAGKLGISFILLAGGEPMLRRDVLETAGHNPDILFPVFTNGTFWDEQSFSLFDHCRNLIPILSIEGGREVTDARRGQGIYDKLIANMDKLKRRGIIFGASITVTTRNLREVCAEAYLKSLHERGCKAVIFVEYVPVTEDSLALAPGDADRAYIRAQITQLRRDHPEMVYIAFPGDEKGTGGCVAAGRGFFHINSQGGAEPCPFSPYSDINVLDTSLRAALNSRLFRKLREGGYLMEDHPGGCTLFDKKDLVERLLAEND